MTKRDPKTGRYQVQLGMYVDSKGYPCFSAGAYRGRRVHRVAAEKKLGRKLRRNEDVHHLDGNKLNFRGTNLRVMGHRAHSKHTARQRFMRLRRMA